MTKTASAPSKTPATDSPADTPSAAVSLLLWLRWALALWAIVTGINELGFYISNWAPLVQKAVVNPAYHPLPFLVLAILHLAGGIVLLLRSKWAFLILGLHFAGYLGQLLWHSSLAYMPAMMMLYLSIEALTLWLCLYLWADNRLR